MFYSLTLTLDDDGSYLVTCDELPEVTSFGEGEAEAVKYGAKAVEEAIAARMDAFQDIPRPSDVADYAAKVPLSLQVKLQLFWALREAGLTRAEFAQKTAWSRTTVDRLFDPRHESKLDKIEQAFDVLGYTVDVHLTAT